MPFRHAHWWLLALVPLILLAFWPGYFGQLRDAPFALHAHGITASLWVVLTGVQSWSIQNRHRALHRSAGLAVFVIVPLFAAAALLAMKGGAELALAHADPFHDTYAARLTLCDLLADATFLVLVYLALAERRRVERHAAAMLSTILLVLPPITARLFPAIPGFPGEGLGKFLPSLHLSEGLAAAIALGLAWRHRRAALPFLIVAAASIAQSAIMETARPWGYEAAGLAIGPVPAPLLAAIGLALGIVTVWSGWSATVTPRRRMASV